jgi:hypothetical protein
MYHADDNMKENKKNESVTKQTLDFPIQDFFHVALENETKLNKRTPKQHKKNGLAWWHTEIHYRYQQ